VSVCGGHGFTQMKKPQAFLPAALFTLKTGTR